MKLSHALAEITSDNALLQTGLTHRLFNLSQLALFLKPQVEARVGSRVNSSAIVMALSRMQRTSHRLSIPELKIDVRHMSIHSHLFTATYAKNSELHTQINTLHKKLERSKSHFTVSEGMNEVTLIFEQEKRELAESIITQKPLYSTSKLASIGVRISARYLETPGFFYLLFQQLLLQNVNIVEIGSTATELILYLHEKDVELAFSTLYRRFS